MKNWWAAIFGLVGGLLGSGVILLVASAPRGQPVQLLPPPTPAPLVVHVTGSVVHPGVYTLPADSRVQDAIAVAGGLQPEANAQALNLAARLQDGMRLSIPAQTTAGEAAASAQDTGSAPGTVLSPGTRVNLNTADQAGLESLPGIGPVTAQKIIAYRDEHGPFSRIEDLQEVSGIGPATFEKLKDLITVEDLP